MRIIGCIFALTITRKAGFAFGMLKEAGSDRVGGGGWLQRLKF